MKLEVVTPFGAKVDETDVTEVVATGELGELGIRPGHVPLITSLKPGRLVYEKGGQRRAFAADAGFLEVHADLVRVLTETLLAAADIDVERAEAALHRAEDGLKDPNNQTGAARKDLEARLARARVRLAIAQQK